LGESPEPTAAAEPVAEPAGKSKRSKAADIPIDTAAEVAR
jgi:hypothetical protein